MVLIDLGLQDSSRRNKSLNRMIPTANPAGQHGAESSVTWVADQYYNQAVRTEWDWENPIIFAQNPTSIANPLVESDHCDQKPTSILAPTPLANIRPYNQAPSYGGSSLAATFPSQNGIMYTFSSGLRNYEDLHAYQALSDAHNSVNSGIPGVAATSNNLNAEFRSYEQRRRFLGMIDLERGIGTDLIKREDVYLGDGRIGLNLGGRTYFSHEDSMEGRLGKRNRLAGPGAHVPRCQAEGCTADLSKAKHYHRRHKVCEIHSKAPNVYANGQTQRFCQQCSRFHPLSEFDDTKRSCRKRLADHNRRRRKPQPNTVSVSITMPEPLAFKSEGQTSVNHSSAMADNRPALLKNNSNSTEAGGSNPKMDSDHHTQGSRSEEKEESSRSIVLASSAADSELLSSVPRSASPSKRRFSSIDPAAMYQQFLQGPGQTKLSLSSSSTHQGENSVNWLKSGSPSRSFDASGSEKFGDSRSCSRSTRFLGESGKGLLKIHSPRHNSSSDWMVSPASGSKDHDPTDHHRQMVAFLENPVRSGANNQARNSASSLHMDHSSIYESSSTLL